MSADLPLSLQMQLTQEAYLVVSIQRLQLAREQMSERFGDLEQKAKSTLTKRGDPVAKAELDDARKHDVVLRDASRFAQKTLDELRAKLEVALEDFLRVASGEYQKGMRGQRYFADLYRAIDRLDLRLRNIRRGIGDARNCISGGYDPQRGVYRDHARKSLETAAVFGEELEEDIGFFDSLVEAHLQTVEATHFARVKLPRFNDFPYKSFVLEQLNVPAHIAQTRLDTMLEECDELHRTGLDRLRDSITQAEKEHVASGESFVLNYWSILRDYARVNWVREDQLEMFMESLEAGMKAAKARGRGDRIAVNS